MILCEVIDHQTLEETIMFFSNRKAIFSYMDKREAEGLPCSVIEIAYSENTVG